MRSPIGGAEPPRRISPGSAPTPPPNRPVRARVDVRAYPRGHARPARRRASPAASARASTLRGARLPDSRVQRGLGAEAAHHAVAHLVPATRAVASPRLEEREHHHERRLRVTPGDVTRDPADDLSIVLRDACPDRVVDRQVQLVRALAHADEPMLHSGANACGSRKGATASRGSGTTQPRPRAPGGLHRPLRRAATTRRFYAQVR